VKDADKFERGLTEHFPLPMEWIIGAPVTEQDLDADGESFLAFASVFGVAPPKANPDAEPPAALRSS
jgi:hypothetical protein